MNFKKVYYQDKEIEKKFAPFSREDYDKISLIKSFPKWLLFIPKMIVSVMILIFGTIVVICLQIGYKRGSPISPQRRYFIKLAGKIVGRALLFTMGVTYINVERPEIDYTKYLGPDWKKVYDIETTLVTNH